MMPQSRTSRRSDCGRCGCWALAGEKLKATDKAAARMAGTIRRAMIRIDMASSRASSFVKRAQAAAAASGNGNPRAFAYPAAHSLSDVLRTVSLSATISGGKRHPPSASIAVEVHRVVADRAGLRGVLPLVRGLCGDRDHVALGQMMTDPALDTGPARLARGGYLRVDHLATGDELRFAIHDDEHVVWCCRASRRRAA